MLLQEKIDEFFAYTRERHCIYLRRQSGEAWPWTDDPILRQYRFTCVFRELDRTTVWVRANVRERLIDRPECLLAMVVARWFNRIEALDVIFNQQILVFGNDPGMQTTPWDWFLMTGDASGMRYALVSAYPTGPYVTGSYMIRSPTGLSKLDGMLKLCSDFHHHSGWRQIAQHMLDNPGDVTMEGFTQWLTESPGQGPFLAYEVACDLQHTRLLDKAPDINTWANVGPGCLRGLNRMAERINPKPRKPSHKYKADLSEEQALDEMRVLLEISRYDHQWSNAWPHWDMRTVEHNLCEFDKYQRVKSGEGVPRQIFRNRGVVT